MSNYQQFDFKIIDYKNQQVLSAYDLKETPLKFTTGIQHLTRVTKPQIHLSIAWIRFPINLLKSIWENISALMILRSLLH